MISLLIKNVTTKQLLLLLMSAMMSVGSVNAQKFSLGVKAGPLVLWSAYGDEFDGRNIDNKLKFGYYGAGLISFPLKNNYSCVIEGGFSQKGRNVRFGGNQNYATYNFIDAALLLRRSFKFNLGKNIPATWFANIGPHVSYWLGGKGTVGSIGNDGTKYKIQFVDSLLATHTDFNTLYMVDANRWLFGADIGIGMTAPIKSTQRVLIELRFTWGHTFYGGLTSANYNWIEFSDRNMRTNERVISLTVAYLWDFDLKERKKGRSNKDKEVHRKPVKKKRR